MNINSQMNRQFRTLNKQQINPSAALRNKINPSAALRNKINNSTNQ